VALAIAEPIYVPDDADAAALDEWRAKLEMSIAACKDRCRGMLAGAKR
jgi:hypothetical protein